MNFFEISAVSIALAMDAFAVSLATGISLKSVSPRQTFRLSWHFGFFQAIMPVIGWSAGLTVRSYIERYDHWTAFGLLTLVGLNMIREGLQLDKDIARQKDRTRGITLVILSMATSIDALAVGFSLSMLKQAIWYPAFIIGIVAAIFTGTGLHLGKKISSTSHLSSYAEVAGGLVLLAIGFNILHAHGALSEIFPLSYFS